MAEPVTDLSLHVLDHLSIQENQENQEKKSAQENQEKMSPQEMTITDLPSQILEHILSRFSTQERARMSILSKDWNSIWKACPHLDFTRVKSVVEGNVNHPEGIDIINGTLARRESSLMSLRFRVCILPSERFKLNEVMESAIRLGVKTLDIDASTYSYFTIPENLKICGFLEVLRLKNMRAILPPPLDGGFPNLHALSLEDITLDNENLVLINEPGVCSLFSDPFFPSLKKLNLERFRYKQLVIRQGKKFAVEHICEKLFIRHKMLKDLSLGDLFVDVLEVYCSSLLTFRVTRCVNDRTDVTIEAPQLRSLFWQPSNFPRTATLNMSCLHEVSWGCFDLIETYTNAILPPTMVPSVDNFLSAIMDANSLTLGGELLRVMSSQNYPRITSHSFNKLKCLEVQIYHFRTIFRGLARLFWIIPKPNTLKIHIYGGDDPIPIETREIEDIYNYWEAESQILKSFLLHLKVVRIQRRNSVSELALVKFLLTRGSGLKEMTIRSAGLKNIHSFQQRVKDMMEEKDFCLASKGVVLKFE